jgi:nicotinamidase-related amidase
MKGPNVKLSRKHGRRRSLSRTPKFVRVRVATTMLPNIKPLQACFRSHGMPVIFCNFCSYLPEGRDLPEWIKDFDQLGLNLFGRRPNPAMNDPIWQVDARVGELVLNKNTSGPLNSNRLNQIVHNAGINSLAVCGLTTAVCVCTVSCRWNEGISRSVSPSCSNETLPTVSSAPPRFASLPPHSSPGVSLGGGTEPVQPS